jgi:hypothetical protein
MRAHPPLADRAAAAWSFLLRFAFMLAFIGAGVCALLLWFEPCATATSLCSAVPLIRQPYTGRGPQWWQRLVLRARLLCLGARQHTARNDVLMLERDLAVYRGLLDTSQHPEERAWLQGELSEISKLHTGCVADEAEASEQIAWAQSDLAKL